MWLKLISVGVIAGISSGLFGIGGGVIIVPILVLLLKYEQSVASATSLVALLMPVGILGVWQYYKSGVISAPQIHSGLWVASGMFIGTLFGAKIALQLSSQTLTRMFAIFLVLVAAKLWLNTVK